MTMSKRYVSVMAMMTSDQKLHPRRVVYSNARSYDIHRVVQVKKETAGCTCYLIELNGGKTASLYYDHYARDGKITSRWFVMDKNGSHAPDHTQAPPAPSAEHK